MCLLAQGLNLQKYAHRRAERSPTAVHFNKMPVWWLGVRLHARTHRRTRRLIAASRAVL